MTRGGLFDDAVHFCRGLRKCPAVALFEQVAETRHPHHVLLVSEVLLELLDVVQVLDVQDVIGLEDDHDRVRLVRIGVVGEQGTPGCRFVDIGVFSGLHGDQGQPKQRHNEDQDRHCPDARGWATIRSASHS